MRVKCKLQALVYDILPLLQEDAGKRCSKCGLGVGDFTCPGCINNIIIIMDT